MKRNAQMARPGANIPSRTSSKRKKLFPKRPQDQGTLANLSAARFNDPHHPQEKAR